MTSPVTFGDDGQAWLKTSYPVFTVMIGESKPRRQLGECQRDVVAACMMLAAYIWRHEEDCPLDELREQALSAARQLSDGEHEVSFGARPHRIYRTDLFFDIPLQGLAQPAWKQRHAGGAG